MAILVTGATGNIGRKVVDQLLARGAGAVRALTTNPAKAALPAGVEVAVGYLRKPKTLPAAFEGVEAMYLAPTPDTVEEVLRLARQAGVQRVVDLSGEHESWWGSVAKAVEASGLAWTHLSPGDFMENTLDWAPQIVATGAVREPYPEGRSTPIAMADIARVAAVALTTLGHEGRSYSLTGPEVLTRVDLVAHIAAATGRPVEFVQVTRDEAVEALRPGMGDGAEWYVDTILQGSVDWHAEVQPTVEQVTGSPATGYGDWVREHAAAFLP
ncbi:NAD(P)H-binding protein [Pseudonocardia pini]|uniref:NAD(P)H-binding protein n=1 Tax=Pseudonocardia pini TaxID=2758030 RepID=UPI0015F0B237|nr:NAD(P)H-binding protein [Pseudonocardia pini]